MASVARRGWPDWTNAPIDVYHGTTRNYAERIANSTVDVSAGRVHTDFGRGFYTTTSLFVAQQRALQVSDKVSESSPAVLRLHISREGLAQLTSISFIRHSMASVDFWSFVQHCRAGLPHLPASSSYYDAVCGPIALTWRGPSNSSTLSDSDQISFHTAAAQAMLNDRSVCQMEVLA
jgi:hypothetical protein